MEIEDVLKQSTECEDVKPEIKEEKMDTSSLTEDEKMTVDDLSSIDDNSCTSLADKQSGIKRSRKNSGQETPPAKQWKGLRYVLLHIHICYPMKVHAVFFLN